MCLPIRRELIDFVRRLRGTRRCARGESQARSKDEARRRRYEALTEPLARQREVLRTVCSDPLLLLSPSRSALSFSLILGHPSFPFAFSLARTFSLTLHHPARTTLRYAVVLPPEVIIVYTRNTTPSAGAILRSCALTRSQYHSLSLFLFLSRAKKSSARFRSL